MAALTFQDLQNEVLAHGFDSSTYLTRVKRWLNEGQWAAIRRAPQLSSLISTSLTTTGGTPYVTLASLTGFVAVANLVDNELGCELTPMSMPWLDQLGNQRTTNLLSGRPTFFGVVYTSAANKLSLWPVPDQAYTLLLRYLALPTEMSANGDAPTIPDAHTDLLVSYAIYRAYRSENDVEMATYFKGEYESELRLLQDEMADKTPSTPKQVPGVWGNIRWPEPWDLR